MNPNNVTYLLIGGGGFLGRNMVSWLLRSNGQVIVIGRKKEYQPIGNERYFTREDPAIAHLSNSKEEFVVVDFAYTTVPNTSFDDPVGDFSSNLYNSVKNLELARSLNLKRYVYVSSGGTVYGDLIDMPIAEDASNFPISPYGITKMASERYVYMHHKVYGLNTCIVRPSNVFGPGQRPNSGQGFIPTAIARVLSGQSIKVYGAGDIIRDYLYVDDFCASLHDVIVHGVDGEIYNIGCGVGLSLQQVLDQMETLARSNGLSVNVEVTAARPFDVRSNVLDNSKARDLSGWMPKVTFETGLSLTWEWMKRHLADQHLS